MNFPLIVDSILEEYTLPWEGDHGVSHWARVFENGMRIAETTGADIEVVQLFALFHDSRRNNEGWDPGHGRRGADFAAQLRGRVFELPDHEFKLLIRACSDHTDQRTHPDITVQSCWDADRLDLGRVGIRPVPERLCTNFAKLSSTINWADGRACFHVVPDLIQEEWKVDLPPSRPWR